LREREDRRNQARARRAIRPSREEPQVERARNGPPHTDQPRLGRSLFCPDARRAPMRSDELGDLCTLRIKRLVTPAANYG